MTEFTLQIDIAAPIERCFDLARSMDFHVRSMREHGERIVDGRASGLIERGEDVEFEAVQLGHRWRLRARVVEFDRPRMFVDEQVRGVFGSLRHEHRFETLPGGGTRMTDRLSFAVRWWMGGVVAARLVARPRLRRVLSGHQRNLKQTLEGEEWKSYLNPATLPS